MRGSHERFLAAALVAVLLAGAATAVVPTAAEAHGKSSRSRASDEAAERAAVRRAERPSRGDGYRRGDSEMDRIRAESCDPGGRFAGYPAWARAAFTCGSQR